jgi:anti-anti-sigma factor
MELFFTDVDTLGLNSVVIRLHGELDISVSEPAWHALVTAAVSADRVVVDLTNLEFIDAAGYRLLTDFERLVASQGGECSMRGAHGIVRRLFQLIESCAVSSRRDDTRCGVRR